MSEPRNPILDEQRELAESEARFRALVTATSDIVYRVSPDWSVMHALDGRGVLSDTHQPITDWLPKYIHPQDQDLVKAAIKKAIDNGNIFQQEHRVLHADGSLGWTFSRAIPIRNADGEVIEWFGAASDITERKRAEEALKKAKHDTEQQQRLYETITSSTPDLIYVFDLDYHFTYANHALLTMWGKTWDTAIGKGLRENGYEEWHAVMHEREIDHVRATKQPIRGEVSFPHATLGKRVYDYIFTPVINANGEVEAVAGTTRDITDIRNAETAISESENRFRTMAEGTDVMIAVGDEAGGNIYFNTPWAVATGRSVEELVARGWTDLVHPDDRESLLIVFDEALQNRSSWQYDFRMPGKEGRSRWFLTRGNPRFRSDGSYAGYISSTIDITGIKENEQRKNDFISMVSHELKTPLTSAITYVQVLQKKAAINNDELSGTMLERAGKQLAKMVRMINGFLNVSRLESGTIPMDKDVFDLASLLKEAEEEAHTLTVGHQIIFEPSPAVMVNADREKIGQVIHNFISNAVKYSPSGSHIRVACTVDNGTATVSVADDGIGIDRHDLPRLFDRYYRVKGAETRNIAGFGIGLYLCSEIIKGHGGRIWAESNLGKGSTFYFALNVEG